MGILPSVGILESHVGSVKGVPFEARSGDSSAVVVASTLASLSHLRKELSLLPKSSGNEEGVQISSEMPPPSTCEMSENRVGDAVMKESPDKDQPTWGDKSISPSPSVPNEDLNLDRVQMGSIDPELAKAGATTRELRPLLRMLTGSASSEYGNISKILVEQRDIRQLLKDLDPQNLTSTRRQVFKDALQRGLLDPDKIDVSFESFPYYLR